MIKTIYVDDDKILPRILDLPEYDIRFIDSKHECPTISTTLHEKDHNEIYILSFGHSPINYIYKDVIKFKDLPNVRFNIRPTYINMLKTLLENDFNVPNTIYGNSNVAIMIKLDPNKKYIVKAKDQARSVGKKILNKKMLRDMVNYIIENTDLSNFEKDFDIDTRTAINKTEEFALRVRLADSTWEELVFQEVVNFTHEFRFLIFKNSITYNSEFNIHLPNMVIENRIGYKPNSVEERNHYVIDFDNFIDSMDFKKPGNIKLLNDKILHVDGKFLKELKLDIYKKIDNFVKKLDAPAISLDIYLDVNKIEVDGKYNPNCWGVFEYSTEFGLEYPDYVLEKIIDYFTESFKKEYLE